MAYSGVKTLCFLVLAMACGGDACDAQGMQQCNTAYIAAVPGASGTQVCDVVNTLVTCMNSKGAGCPSAAMAQFNTMTDAAKNPVCSAGGSCANHTLCTGGGSQAVSASSARSSSMSWFLIALVVFCFSLIGDACDAQGMQQCNSDYLTAVPGTTGTQVCDVVGTLVTCMNSKGAGCPSAAMAQFNTMVSTVKDPVCVTTGACANHTLCTGAGNTGASVSSLAWTARSSMLTVVCMYLGLKQ